MNILQITTDFGQGGAERVFSQLGVELSKTFNVIECVFNTDGVRKYPSANVVVDLKTPQTNNYIKKIYYFFLRIHRLRAIKRRYEIRVSISHLEGADYVNVLSRVNERVIVVVHGTKVADRNIDGVTGWVRRNILIPFLYRRADTIVTVSNGIKEELKSCFRLNNRPIHVIHNFFDVEKISSLAQKPVDEYDSLFQNYDVLITSGRLSAPKNQRLLLRIFPALRAIYPSMKLLLLGEGELYHSLVQEAISLKLKVKTMDLPYSDDYDVYFGGFQENPFKFISRSRLFLFPSLWEGFPMALCEALACRVPVISFDCPTGPREILTPFIDGKAALQANEYRGVGALIPLMHGGESKFAVESWIDAITTMMRDGDLRQRYIGEGKERVANAFSAREILPKWEKLITDEHRRRN